MNRHPAAFVARPTMEIDRLIDEILRETMQLVAALATVADTRRSVAHVDDRAFVALARALEARGLSRKVVADMFGVTLRTYQRKMLNCDSEQALHRTIWSIVRQHVADGGCITRQELLRRFNREDAKLVGAALNDLLNTGLVRRIGTGETARYLPAEPETDQTVLDCQEPAAQALRGLRDACAAVLSSVQPSVRTTACPPFIARDETPR
jgi:hypothetical protein